MLRKLFSRWFSSVLFLGVILRLIVMPITMHPDLWGQSIASHLFASDGVVNVYDYLYNLTPQDAINKNFLAQYLYIYPPLMYFTQGILKLLVLPLANPDFMQYVIDHGGDVLSFPAFQYQVFVLKLPYLFLDLAAGFLIAGMFKSEKNKHRALTLWMLNPVSLYVTFMLAQNDILPVFFSILALYLIRHNRNYLGVIALGIAGSYKMYPLLLLIPASLLLSPNWIKRIKLLIAGLIPYIISVGPFVFSDGYRNIVLSNTESQKVLFMVFRLSGAEGVFPFVALIVVIYLMAYYRNSADLNNYFISILLLVYSVTHYHPQWFLWIIPFLIIYLVENNYRYFFIFVILIASWLVTTLLFEKSLSFGMFYPVFPEIQKWPNLSDVLGKYTDVMQFKSLVRSVFAGVALYLSVRLLKPIGENNKDLGSAKG